MRKLLAALIFTVAFVPQSANAASGIFIASCLYDHTTVADPIGHATHIHDFSGAKAIFSDDVTTAEMRAGGTSCIEKADSSGYWVPQLHAGGSVVPPNDSALDDLFYYTRQGSSPVHIIPDGLKMVLGNAMATSPSENPALMDGRIYFKCGPGSNPHLMSPPSSCNSGMMVIVYTFPNCWDGIHLDSYNHFAHMSYPQGGGCPLDHPVNLPRIQAFWRYDVGPGPIGNVTLASGGYWSAHMDFFSAWDQNGLRDLINQCLNPGAECGVNP